MSLLEDSSDDPEELRRQMEAREAAQNLALSSAWLPEPSARQPGSAKRICPNRTNH